MSFAGAFGLLTATNDERSIGDRDRPLRDPSRRHRPGARVLRRAVRLAVQELPRSVRVLDGRDRAAAVRRRDHEHGAGKAAARAPTSQRRRHQRRRRAGQGARRPGRGPNAGPEHGLVLDLHGPARQRVRPLAERRGGAPGLRQRFAAIEGASGRFRRYFGWLRDQTSRSPCRVSSGSTTPIVRVCGAIRSARPPVATTTASGAPSSSRIRSTIASTWPGEAVDEPRLERGRRRLADHPLGRANGTFGRRAARANSASIEISIPGASTPPANSPAAVDDVEVRRRAEVDDHRGRRRGARARRRRSRSGPGRPRAGRRSGSARRSARPARARAGRHRPSARRTPRTRGRAAAPTSRGRSRRATRGRRTRAA